MYAQNFLLICDTVHIQRAYVFCVLVVVFNGPNLLEAAPNMLSVPKSKTTSLPLEVPGAKKSSENLFPSLKDTVT